MRALVLSTLILFGCSDANEGMDAAVGDMSVGDLLMEDFSVVGPDLARTTGVECSDADAGCLGSMPLCITMSQGTPWPNGYCSSVCQPAMNDATTGLNPACPGRATCFPTVGSNGICVL